ncbi:Kelch-like protein 13, partial [Dissostichus eleginoides]
ASRSSTWNDSGRKDDLFTASGQNKENDDHSLYRPFQTKLSPSGVSSSQTTTGRRYVSGSGDEPRSNRQSLGRGEGGGFSKREAVKQVSRLPATHGECHSFSELKPTGPLCEGEALPSDTDNSTPVQLQVLCGQDIR